MNTVINVLIMDDHPIIIGAYRRALEELSKSNPEFSFCIFQATAMDEALDLIDKKFSRNKLDLLILDISMPKSKRNNLHSGEDLGQHVNIKLENYPDTEFEVLNGIVNNISLIPDKDGLYLIDVKLPEKLMTLYNKKIDFKQEMRGSAEIITEDLRLIERFFYLFKEILKR
ncbi:hypothetical protein ACFSQP_10275 [Bizionia sediminis]|uniref:Response regulator transcription factor n=1 Tax=Bizionia sediminis TaxID=1737064 RepID=A0ABW5KXF4_9FLAO